MPCSFLGIPPEYCFSVFHLVFVLFFRSSGEIAVYLQMDERLNVGADG